jgi:hypothetical protein
VVGLRHLLTPARRQTQMLALALAAAFVCALGATASQSAPTKQSHAPWCGGTLWRLIAYTAWSLWLLVAGVLLLT